MQHHYHILQTRVENSKQELLAAEANVEDLRRVFDVESMIFEDIRTRFIRTTERVASAKDDIESACRFSKQVWRCWYMSIYVSIFVNATFYF